MMKKTTIITIISLVIFLLISNKVTIAGEQTQNKEMQNVSVSSKKNLQNIYCATYTGTLGKNKITVQFYEADYENKYSLYLYDKYNTPILLKRDKKANFLRFAELHPNKTKDKQLEVGYFEFKNNKEYAKNLKGNWVSKNRKKSYPVKLKLTNWVSEDRITDCHALQYHSNRNHYFKVIPKEGVNGLSEKAYFVKQIEVYSKKTNQKIQTISNLKADFSNIMSVEPTNTKPEGIQLGYFFPFVPNNYGELSLFTAYLLKDGRYIKDTKLKGYEYNKNLYEYDLIYQKYDKYGDIITWEGNYQFSKNHRVITLVTSKPTAGKIILESLDVRSDMSTFEYYDKNGNIVRANYIPYMKTMEEADKAVYTKIEILNPKTRKVISSKLKTNYSKSDYELSADGKTLLKWYGHAAILDLNGQKDLQQVEKIDPEAFMDILVDITGLHRVILNKNFKEIPKSIKDISELADRTEPYNDK